MGNILKRVPFVDWTLKGIGQIMLQENPWTGLLFVVGLALSEWHYALAACVATVVGTLSAKFLKFDSELIQKGIYGFNPALVGVALLFLFKSTVVIWLCVVVIGGILTPLLHHLFIKKDLSVFTFPFILMTWISFLFLEQIFHLERSAGSLFKWDPFDEHWAYYLASVKGYGQVIFQENILVGFLFFMGVFIHRPLAALYGLAASFIGLFVGMGVGFPIEGIHQGFWGFNPVLTTIVFAGPKKENLIWAFIGVFLTIFIQVILVRYEVLDSLGGIFTFPFVLGTWITLWLKFQYTKVKIDKDYQKAKKHVLSYRTKNRNQKPRKQL